MVITFIMNIILYLLLFYKINDSSEVIVVFEFHLLVLLHVEEHR